MAVTEEQREDYTAVSSRDADDGVGSADARDLDSEEYHRGWGLAESAGESVRDSGGNGGELFDV